MSEVRSKHIDDGRSVEARVKAVSHLLQHPQEHDEARAINRLLTVLEQDNSPEVRSIAALALGKFGDPRVMGPLIAVLDDPSAKVRRYAALGISRSTDERAFYPLLRALRDPSRGVRGAAAEALRALGDARARGPIAALLLDDDITVRCSALRALGQFGDLPSIPVMVETLRDRFAWRGRAAIFGQYCALLPEKDLVGLIEYLSHEDEDVREMVVVALRSRGRVIPALVAALPGSDHRERHVIVDILLCYANSLPVGGDVFDIVVSALRALAADLDAAVRAVAIEALGLIEAWWEADVLIDALTDPAGRVRMTAIWALGVMEDTHVLVVYQRSLRPRPE